MHGALVVDDDRDIRETVAELLEDQGYQVHCASDGREALAWLQEHPRETQVVVLDMMMPGMNGEEFLTEKETRPQLADLPVVVVSAQDSNDLARRHPSIKEWLTKPIRFDHLLRAIAHA
jgi:CheY-like chemotaxis protein